MNTSTYSNNNEWRQAAMRNIWHNPINILASWAHTCLDVHKLQYNNIWAPLTHMIPNYEPYKPAVCNMLGIPYTYIVMINHISFEVEVGPISRVRLRLDPYEKFVVHPLWYQTAHGVWTFFLSTHPSIQCLIL